jgi:hypothetical protein
VARLVALSIVNVDMGVLIAAAQPSCQSNHNAYKTNGTIVPPSASYPQVRRGRAAWI